MRFLATALSYSALALRYALGGLMLWGAGAKRHCKRWLTQKYGFPYLAVAWGIRNFFALSR